MLINTSDNNFQYVITFITTSNIHDNLSTSKMHFDIQSLVVF